MELTSNEALETFIPKYGCWFWTDGQPYMVVRGPKHEGLHGRFGGNYIRSKKGWVWTGKSRDCVRSLCAFLKLHGSVLPSDRGLWQDLPKIYEWACSNIHKPKIRKCAAVETLAAYMKTLTEPRSDRYALFTTAFTSGNNGLSASVTIRVTPENGRCDWLENLAFEFGGCIYKGNASNSATGKRGKPSGPLLSWSLRDKTQIEDLIWSLIPYINEETGTASERGAYHTLSMIRSMKPEGGPPECYDPDFPTAIPDPKPNPLSTDRSSEFCSGGLS